MECKICGTQSIGKSETEFNIRLNDHRKDFNKRNMPQSYRHFNLPNHNFNQHARFTLIEHPDNANIDKYLKHSS